MKNKIAGTKLLAVWWFVVLVTIAAGIILGVSYFRADKLDVRGLESSILVEQITNCLVINGYLQVNLLDKEAFFSNCPLNREIIENSSYYFAKIRVINSSSILTKELILGNNALEKECLIGKSMTRAKNFPLCYDKSISVLDSNGETLKLNLIAGSNYEFNI